MTALQSEDLLTKVLVLEQQQQFRNRAAVGGLSVFASELVRRDPSSPNVSLAALALEDYENRDMDARRQAVEEAIGKLRAGNTTARLGSREPAVLGRSSSVPLSGTGQGPETGPLVAKTSIRQPRKKRTSKSSEATLDSPLDCLSGVGPSSAKSLESAGIRTIRDLLYYFPRQHVDFRKRDAIRSLRYGDRITLVGVIRLVRTRYPRKGLSITTATIADESGSISAQWFNRPYLEKQLEIGRTIAITGDVSSFDGRLVLIPQDYEWVGEGELTHGGRLAPMYRLRSGMSQKPLRSLMRRVVEHFASMIEEYLPPRVLDPLGLMGESQAIGQYHFPSDDEDLSAAQRRLSFDELFAMQVGLIRRKLQNEEEGRAPPLTLSPEQTQMLRDSLGFELTSAQERVLIQLQESLLDAKPMSRLLQGDVGSGKTVIGAFALASATMSEHQGVLMAPTEILALQHCDVLRRWLEPLGVRVECLVGGSTAKERRRITAGIADGSIDVLVGTHTLFQDALTFSRLGVVVVDEQHRFGVIQRTRLRNKGVDPHVLVMTATPIPRTLALTLYGDLDISVLDELPSGRIPIETTIVEQATAAYGRVREEVLRGRQAFVVCPVIEETSSADTKSAIAEHRRLQQAVFRDRAVGLLHGKLNGKEKDDVLTRFRDRHFDVLVATSVVEVGIDIPNATVMVILDAHRFGLAQLHQLRGRIGRGSLPSYCILVSGVPDGPGKERLEALVRSRDGFYLAEEDLRLRGPGEFWGTRQSGLPDLRATKPGDVKTMEEARHAALAILDVDPSLETDECTGIRDRVEDFWSHSVDLS